MKLQRENLLTYCQPGMAVLLYRLIQKGAQVELIKNTNIIEIWYRDKKKIVMDGYLPDLSYADGIALSNEVVVDNLIKDIDFERLSSHFSLIRGGYYCLTYNADDSFSNARRMLGLQTKDVYVINKEISNFKKTKIEKITHKQHEALDNLSNTLFGVFKSAVYLTLNYNEQRGLLVDREIGNSLLYHFSNGMNEELGINLVADEIGRNW